MKIYYILLLALFSLASISQECKYKIQKLDKFTGLNELELEPVLLVDKVKSDEIKISSIKMILGKKGNEKFFSLSFIWVSKGLPRFVAFNDNKLICLLENGVKVELPMLGTKSDVNKSKLTTHFSISEEAFSLLEKNNITDIRAVAAVNPFDLKINDISTKTNFNCIK